VSDTTEQLLAWIWQAIIWGSHFRQFFHHQIRIYYIEWNKLDMILQTNKLGVYCNYYNFDILLKSRYIESILSYIYDIYKYTCI
jgi:hypothetical protein